MVDILGIELIVAFVIIVPFMVLGAAWLRRTLTRGHVWYHIGDGVRVHRGHGKPDENGDLHDLGGTYHTTTGGTALPFELVVPGWGLSEAPLFRYNKGDGWPLASRKKKVYKMVEQVRHVKPSNEEEKTLAMANGGTIEKKVRVPAFVGYEVYWEPQRLPAEAEEVFMGQKVFADAYAGHGKLLLLLTIGLVVLMLLVIGLYVKR